MSRRRCDFCQAEVENFGVSALGDEDVGGLDIAMDDAFAMGGIEGVGDLDRQAEQHIHFQRTAGDAMLEGQAVQVLHGNEGLAILFANVVDGADVGVVQGGRRFGLTPEALQCLTILSHVFRQEFESDETIEPGVFGLVNDTHAAAAQLFNNAVVGDSLADHSWGSFLGLFCRDDRRRSDNSAPILGGHPGQVNVSARREREGSERSPYLS